MEKEWVKVFTTENVFTAEVLMQGLLENEIPAVTINKKISVYNLGVINVLVHPDYFDRAIEYIVSNEINEA